MEEVDIFTTRVESYVVKAKLKFMVSVAVGFVLTNTPMIKSNIKIMFDTRSDTQICIEVTEKYL